MNKSNQATQDINSHNIKDIIMLMYIIHCLSINMIQEVKNYFSKKKK